MTRCQSLIVALLFSVSLAGFVGVAPPAVAGDDADLTVALDFTYSSLYHWRGTRAGDGSFAMPSVDVSYALPGGLTLGANVWYAQGDKPNEDTDNNEIDYTAYADLAVGSLDLFGGAIDYVIPGDAPFADGHVLEVHGGLSLTSLPFDNSVTFYQNIDGDDDDSMYLAASVGHELGDLSVGLTAGLGDGFYSTDGDLKLVELTPTASYTVPFAGSEAAVSLSIGYNPDAKRAIPFFTFGTGWSWTP